MLALTKQQLKVVNAYRGWLDSDSGRVFVGVAGQLEADGLYHVEARYREKGDAESLDVFSLSEILSEEDE